jgi:hypothetical protein
MTFGRHYKITGEKNKPVDILSFESKDFSDVEDSLQAFAIISTIAFQAGQSAAAEARAMGIPRIFARNNQVIRVYANGREEVVPAPLPSTNSFYVHYNHATVFHAGKK